MSPGTGSHPLAGFVGLLAETSLFGGLDSFVLEELAATMEPVHVPAGAVLMQQGQPGDALHVVASGRLRVFTSTPSGTHVLGELSRGDVVGEIALLSAQPRTATVRAVRDSETRRLSGDAFMSLIDSSPGLLRRVADLVIARLLSRDRGVETSGTRTVALIAAGAPHPLDDFGEALVDALARDRGAIRLTSAIVDAKLGAGGSEASLGSASGSETLLWLHEQEESHGHIVYQADPRPTPWTERCLRQADLVLLVGDATNSPALGEAEIKLLQGDATTAARRELVLLKRSAGCEHETAAWIAKRQVAAWHQVYDTSRKDVARLARLITGRGCGLVLGGGAARGLAHLGVMRALEEAGVPIDVVGGTSIGAITGYLHCCGFSYSEQVALVEEALLRTRPLEFPTLPVLSLSAGRRLKRMLTDPRFATDGDIEDLRIPFFCISTNLTRARVEVHDRGEIYPALRASVSLPGVFPPVWQHGDVQFVGFRRRLPARAAHCSGMRRAPSRR